MALTPSPLGLRGSGTHRSSLPRLTFWVCCACPGWTPIIPHNSPRQTIMTVTALPGWPGVLWPLLPKCCDERDVLPYRVFSSLPMATIRVVLYQSLIVMAQVRWSNAILAAVVWAPKPSSKGLPLSILCISPSTLQGVPMRTAGQYESGVYSGSWAPTTHPEIQKPLVPWMS